MLEKKVVQHKSDNKTLLSPNHRACAGCGQLVAARTVLDTLGPNTIVANATGCLEVTTTAFPDSSWGVAWIHSLFENAAALASGINAALEYRKKRKDVKILAQGGDGATFDIGFGLISGMWTRKENIIYVCYDNEGYMNTGAQASGATSWGAATTTTPVGSHLPRKDMLAVALAHGLKYVAQTTVGFPQDIVSKVKKAMTTDGPSYIQILVPCIPGWKFESSQTIKLGQLAAQTGHYPIVEFVDGQLAGSMKISQPQISVEEYLKLQGRFKHLFLSADGKQQIEFIQNLANENIKKYNLI